MMISKGDLIWLKGRSRWFRVAQVFKPIAVRGALGDIYQDLVSLEEFRTRETFMTQLDHDSEGLSWIHLGRARMT